MRYLIIIGFVWCYASLATAGDPFAGEFEHANWEIVTQDLSCGSSSVDTTTDSVTLSTPRDCDEPIEAVYRHVNGGAGATTDGTVSISFDVTTSADHSFAAFAGVEGRSLTELTSERAESGNFSFDIDAGEQIVFVLRKSGSVESASFNVFSFLVTPASTRPIADFSDVFEPDSWTVRTQSFGCGSSTVEPSDTDVVLSTASGCAGIFSRYTHDTGAPFAGVVSFNYEVTQSEPHNYEASVVILGQPELLLATNAPASGRFELSVPAGAQLQFVVRKIGGSINNGISRLRITDFQFVAPAGFVGEFRNQRWLPLSQSLGCGSSSVVENAETIRLRTAPGCNAIRAQYEHANGNDYGASRTRNVRFSYEITETARHAYRATVNVLGRNRPERELIDLGTLPGTGLVDVNVAAGEALLVELRKSSGSGRSTLFIRDFAVVGVPEDLFSEGFEQ